MTTTRDSALQAATGTVPVLVAELAALHAVAPVSVLERCGRYLGDRVELDLDALGRVDHDAAAWCGAYWARCEAFWAEAATTGRPRGAYVLIERELRSVVQTDTKAARTDLRAELDALEAQAGLTGVLDALLGAEIDDDALLAHVHAFRGSVRRVGADTVVRLVVPVGRLWPLELGGAASMGETARVIELTANHAAWRDRKVRRLRAVTVSAQEIWPEPVVG